MDWLLQHTDSNRRQPGFRQGLISQYISISQACYQASLDQTVCVSQAHIHISPRTTQKKRVQRFETIWSQVFGPALIYIFISVKRETNDCSEWIPATASQLSDDSRLLLDGVKMELIVFTNKTLNALGNTLILCLRVSSMYGRYKATFRPHT